MRRLTAILLLLLLTPGLALGQWAPARAAAAAGHAANGPAEAWLVPVWQTPDGRLMALVENGQTVHAPLRLVAEDGSADAAHGADLLSLDGGHESSAGISFKVGQRLYSSLRLDSLSSPADRAGCRAAGTPMPACLNARPGWQGGTLLGGYRADGLLIDLGMNWLQHDRGVGGLLLVVPDVERSSLMGIPSQWIESLDRINARGSLELGNSGAHLDMGASLGRVRLLPGHLTVRPEGAGLFSGFQNDFDTIDQKAVSLGLGKGAISGTVVGRLMQPGGGSLERGTAQWSAIDLGITVRLPWEGELSLGAQNLWSSGDKTKLPSQDGDPVQSRIPYIQYHQEL